MASHQGNTNLKKKNTVKYLSLQLLNIIKKDKTQNSDMNVEKCRLTIGEAKLGSAIMEKSTKTLRKQSTHCVCACWHTRTSREGKAGKQWLHLGPRSTARTGQAS